jgi:hypothetical protein
MFAGQLIACRKPTAHDLVGTWQVDYRTSKLMLTLNQDGTFEQVFQKKGDTNLIHRTGKWALTDFEGPSVDLTGALIVRDDDGMIDSELSAYKDGGWILHVNQTLGHLSLTVNEDLGLSFEKSRE